MAEIGDLRSSERMSDLRTVLMDTLKGMSERCLKGTAAPSVKWMQEFRALAEEVRKLEDLGEVQKLQEMVAVLSKRVMDVETALNLRKLSQQAEAGRRTPRIMG